MNLIRLKGAQIVFQRHLTQWELQDLTTIHTSRHCFLYLSSARELTFLENVNVIIPRFMNARSPVANDVVYCCLLYATRPGRIDGSKLPCGPAKIADGLGGRHQTLLTRQTSRQAKRDEASGRNSEEIAYAVRRKVSLSNSN